MREPRYNARIIAVGGGKGGVGKTLVAANLAIAFARSGKDTLLVDGDLGGANLHTALGLAPPIVSLADMMFRRASITDVAVRTGYENLRLISGALDDASAANPKHQEKMRLIRHLSKVPCEVLIIDLGAGSNYNTLDLFLVADDGVLVVVPEPTSVENAYRFLKNAFLRRLKAVEKVYGIGDLLAEATSQKNRSALKTPLDILRAISARDHDVGAQVELEMARFSPRLILNQVRIEPGNDDRLVADDMAAACRRFFGIQLRVLGTISDDEAVKRAIRARVPALIHAPNSVFADDLTAIFSRLSSSGAKRGRAA